MRRGPTKATLIGEVKRLEERNKVLELENSLYKKIVAINGAPIMFAALQNVTEALAHVISDLKRK